MRARGELKTTLQPLRDSRIETRISGQQPRPAGVKAPFAVQACAAVSVGAHNAFPSFGYPLSAGAAGVCGDGSGNGAAGGTAAAGYRARTSNLPAVGPGGSTITEFGNLPTRQSAATRPGILRAARFLSIGRSQFGAGAIPALYRRLERCGLGCEDLRCADRPRRQGIRGVCSPAGVTGCNAPSLSVRPGSRQSDVGHRPVRRSGRAPPRCPRTGRSAGPRVPRCRGAERRGGGRRRQRGRADERAAVRARLHGLAQCAALD